MNLLLDELPTRVEINEKKYEINMDFRISILYELLMLDSSVDSYTKAEAALRLYYPVLPADIGEAMEAISWFYRCGREDKGGTGKREARQELIYSFEYDDAYIFSAFLGQYGIDLNDIKYLHWWKFKALFKALGEGNEFVKIMGYRAIKISNNMTREQKEFYKEMKELYQLPRPQNEQEKLDEITAALLGDGNLKGLI